MQAIVINGLSLNIQDGIETLKYPQNVVCDDT